jgi:hypothetical protein
MSTALKHPWQTIELEFVAEREYDNPYCDVEIWVDLTGPDFEKRIFGFWDGENRFIVRIVATSPGVWRWNSGSTVEDPGLTGRQDKFEVVAWTDSELEENPCRRGFLRPTKNGHGLMYADGTPHYYLADTWWAAGTFRYPWREGAGEAESTTGSTEEATPSFQDLVTRRKSQGFTGIAMLAAFPHWADDGSPSTIVLDDGLSVRQAWQASGSSASSDKNPAKNMHNEGGRPFEFPGRVPGYENVVPDFDRINPDYFRFMDRKIAYLNAHGMIPFIEASRRDAIPVWHRYHEWPDSYARYIHYLFSRYQAYNVLLSPIHYDYDGFTIPSREFNKPANLVIERYGEPPFGNLMSANSAPSTLVNFGGEDEAKWLTLHQTGNWRAHENYWYLTEIFQSKPARPAMNGEPYYPGFPNDEPPAPSETATRYCRSGLYGSLLSGGLGGFMYGVEGMWGGNIESGSKYTINDAMTFESGDQIRHVRAFLAKCDDRVSEFIPCHEMLVPSRSGEVGGYEGWAYAAHIPGMRLVLIYLEQAAPIPTVRSLLPNQTYRFEWFDPRKGSWLSDNSIELTTDATGRLSVPEPPTSEDWAAALTAAKEI